MHLDIFKNNAFGLSSLTAAINERPFAPGQVGRLGIHTEKSISTTTFSIENQNGVLVLIPNTPRNAPSNRISRDSRHMRHFTVPHLPLQDEIHASEIQNLRPFGSETELATAQSEVNTRMDKLNRSHDATVEYGRIGSVKGIILDANGEDVIYDLYQEFGIEEQEVDYLLGTDTTDMVTKGTDLANEIEDELGQDLNSGIYVFCGKTFFKRFISHKQVRDAYKEFEAKNQRYNPNREDLRYAGFTHGGVTYVQYRGKVGAVPFVADTEAHAFPLGVPELFITAYAPANYMETVNTPGLPRYAKMVPDPSGLNKFVVLDTQSNPLSICTRPKVLRKLKSSN